MTELRAEIEALPDISIARGLPDWMPAIERAAVLAIIDRLATPVADTAGIDAAVVDALARVYNQDRSSPADKAPAPYLAVALVCDEQLDRSGALLGRVRDAAAALRTPQPEGEPE